MTDDAFEKFAAMLDAPPAENPRLRRLLATPAPWSETMKAKKPALTHFVAWDEPPIGRQRRAYCGALIEPKLVAVRTPPTCRACLRIDKSVAQTIDSLRKKD